MGKAGSEQTRNRSEGGGDPGEQSVTLVTVRDVMQA